MVTIGIDQSLTSTGVVVTTALSTSPAKVVTHSEVIQTKKTYNDPMEDLNARVGLIVDRVVHLVQKLEVDEVYMEGLSFGSSGQATRNLAALYGALNYALRELCDKEAVTVPPKTLKKFATGNGNASKEEMLHEIGHWDSGFWHKLDKMPKSHGKYDLADAYFLSRYGETKNED